MITSFITLYPRAPYVSSQILCEFYSIVTNARRVPKPRSPADALGAISGLLVFLPVLPVPLHTVERWLNMEALREQQKTELGGLLAAA